MYSFITRVDFCIFLEVKVMNIGVKFRKIVIPYEA
jgi:hypothetical protein